MAVYYDINKLNYSGLFSDDKPTGKIYELANFTELDTKTEYVWSNKNINPATGNGWWLKGAVDSLIKPSNYLYVSKNGNDTAGDGSLGSPYLTVQRAIDVASSGYTIGVYPGMYTENITLKAGVNITSPVKYGVYIIGNHVSSFSGTVIGENIVLQNAATAGSGTTLSFSGSAAANLQLINSFVNSVSPSGAGDAIVWTNTNSASKIQLLDGNVSVLHSNASARCFYSTTGATGSFIANRASFKVDAPDNIALAIGGAIAFTHTSDSVVGQVVVAGTAAYVSGLVSMTTTNTPVLTTTSSGMSVLSSVPITTLASPAVAGTGGIAFVALMYLSTGVGGAATLNGGLGASPLTMSPVRIRTSTLLPAAAVAAGALDGTIEKASDGFYFTVGTTRTKLVL